MPRRDKTGLLDSVRQGSTQTGLYSQRRRFRILEKEGLYFPCSDWSKYADQLCSHCIADLRLFSHRRKSGFLKIKRGSFI